jgi:hypothetical protein
MIHQLARKCFPAVGSVAGDFRVSGVILLSGALLLAAALFATLANSGMLQLLPVSMLPVFVLWLMGMHRLLWAGTASFGREPPRRAADLAPQGPPLPQLQDSLAWLSSAA